MVKASRSLSMRAKVLVTCHRAKPLRVWEEGRKKIEMTATIYNFELTANSVNSEWPAFVTEPIICVRGSFSHPLKKTERTLRRI